jgi:hypothetical protein
MADDPGPPPKDVIGLLDYYLVTHAPVQIPDPAREWIVRFGPWICLALLALSVPYVFALLGFGAMLRPIVGAGYAAGFGLAAVFLLASVGLMVLALPGLFARRMAGWRLMLYAQVASAAGSLVGGSIFGAVIGGVIGFYILFQVRGLYRN